MNKPHRGAGPGNETPHLPRNVQRFLGVFFAGVALLMLADVAHLRHAVFPWEEWFGFYAIYGFVMCVLLVLGAKHLLRPLVMRDEDYYDR